MKWDFIFALRLLRRSTGFSLIAIICLALGMGAIAAVFTVVDAVVFRPLPYPTSAKLVRIYTEFTDFPGGGLRRFPVSPPEFAELRQNLKSFDRMDAWSVGAVNLGSTHEPLRVTATYVTGGLFDSLGVHATRGRVINNEDDREGAPLTVVLGHGLWTRAFGGNPNVVGTTVRLNGEPATVSGVMPEGFQYPPGQVDVSEVFLPLQLTNAQLQRRGNHRLALLGRLRDGVTLEQAKSETQSLLQGYLRRSSENFHSLQTRNHPIVMYGMQDEVIRTVKPAMIVVSFAVGFVLLIACVNVANLLLARAEARQKEISVRTAMGAGAVGLVRQFLMEGLILSVVGTVLGIVIAIGGTKLLLWAAAGAIPRAEEVTLHWRVLLFSMMVLLFTTFVFGVAPLAQALTRSTYDTLKAVSARNSATRTAAFLRRGLVVSELALALILLISSGLMIKTFWRLQQVEVGMRQDHLLTMRLSLPQSQYKEPASVYSFYSRLQNELAQLPGVTSATLSTGLPPERALNANDTKIEGFVPRPGGPMQNIDYYNIVGDKYVETTGARLIEGRTLDARDAETAPKSVLVNETMARTFWPGQSALGHRVSPSGGPETWYTVVGVLADMKNAGLDKPTGTELFFPFRQLDQGPARTLTLVLHTAGDPETLITPVRNVIRSLDSALPLASIRTMDNIVAEANSRPRFLSVLLSFFTTIAVILAAIGVYGVIAYSVERRTSEFGIRMALGAGAPAILRMVLQQAVWLGGAGIVIGFLASIAVSRMIRSLFFNAERFDASTFALMTIGLLVVTLLASYAPARRATKIDPATALRYE